MAKSITDKVAIRLIELKQEYKTYTTALQACKYLNARYGRSDHVRRVLTEAMDDCITGIVALIPSE